MSDGHADSAGFLNRLLDDVALHYLIVVAAQLGVADILDSGPRSTTDLAASLELDPRSLGRMMRRLASRGLFRLDDNDRWALTPLADALRKEAPNSVRADVLMSGTESNRRTWENVLYTLQTGAPAFDHVFGKPYFDYLAEHPDLSRLFNDAMARGSSHDEAAIVAAHDFSAYRRIVDVGGGHGGLLATILERYPTSAGVLFDRPEVVAQAHGPIDAYVAAGRVETIAGDFCETVPPAADAYLLKWILHDWDDKIAIRILTNCRTEMARGGRVLIIEAVIGDDKTDPSVTAVDIIMMVFTGSRERTEREYRDLLDRAGLTFSRLIPTDSPFSIIEATS